MVRINLPLKIKSLETCVWKKDQACSHCLQRCARPHVVENASGKRGQSVGAKVTGGQKRETGITQLAGGYSETEICGQ